MKTESIEAVAEACILAIHKLDIDTTDKMELLLNVYHFLDPEKYKENIELLSKHEEKTFKRR